jgi:hypothetical protein
MPNSIPFSNYSYIDSGGNHDGYLESIGVDEASLLLSNAKYCLDEMVEFRGIKFFMTPWKSRRGCFYRAEGFSVPYEMMEEKRSIIPNDADVVVTHPPPFGVVGNRLGCPHLLDALHRVQPTLFLCGHFHGYRGAEWLPHQDSQSATGNHQSTLCVNAAVQRSGNLRKPIVIDYKSS